MKPPQSPKPAVFPLLLALGALVLLLGRAVFSPKPEKPPVAGVSAIPPQTADTTLNGHGLFKTRCIRCHCIPVGGTRCENGLRGIYRRIPEPKNAWMAAYLSNADSLRAAGDTYALAIHEKYNRQPFNHRFRFGGREWVELLVFLKTL